MWKWITKRLLLCMFALWIHYYTREYLYTRGCVCVCILLFDGEARNTKHTLVAEHINGRSHIKTHKHTVVRRTNVYGELLDVKLAFKNFVFAFWNVKANRSITWNFIPCKHLVGPLLSAFHSVHFSSLSLPLYFHYNSCVPFHRRQEHIYNGCNEEKKKTFRNEW